MEQRLKLLELRLVKDVCAVVQEHNQCIMTCLIEWLRIFFIVEQNDLQKKKSMTEMKNI